MEINGKHYHDPNIQLKEMRLAVDRLPFSATIRPHFDFLFGYIDVLQQGGKEAEEGQAKVEELEEEIEEALSDIEGALIELGEKPPEGFKEALAALIESAIEPKDDSRNSR